MFSNQSLELEQLPVSSQVEYEPLATKAPLEDIYSNSIVYAALLIGFFVFDLFTEVLPNQAVYYVPLVAVFLWLTHIWYSFTSFKQKGIAAREHDILYRRGLIWRKVTIIPFNRIQHIETHRGPFARMLGLSAVKIFSAGGLGSDLVIAGLSTQRASQLRQLILEKSHRSGANAEEIERAVEGDTVDE